MKKIKARDKQIPNFTSTKSCCCCCCCCCHAPLTGEDLAREHNEENNTPCVALHVFAGIASSAPSLPQKHVNEKVRKFALRKTPDQAKLPLSWRKVARRQSRHIALSKQTALPPYSVILPSTHYIPPNLKNFPKILSTNSRYNYST